MGHALIKAHLYERAVTYYKAAIKTSGQNLAFCYDLGHLLWRLNRFEQSREIINTALQASALRCKHVKKIELTILLILDFLSLSLS